MILWLIIIIFDKKRMRRRNAKSEKEAIITLTIEIIFPKQVLK